ncbi:MAG: lipocalin family protein [Ferruginibacter sp.]|nr:lipocalin family protein [Cytophagales bacterium]
MKTTCFPVLILAASLLLPACSSHDDEKPNREALLAGAVSKTWQFSRLTNDGGEPCLSECSRQNTLIRFYRDGRVESSIYTCDERSCDPSADEYTAKVDGDSGTWRFKNETTLVVGPIELQVVTLTENEFTYQSPPVGPTSRITFVPTDDRALLNRTQLLAGTAPGGKTWKYLKRIVNGVAQPLSPSLQATRFTNRGDGTVTTSYADPSFGSPVAGTWNFGNRESTYTSLRPASGTLPALNMTFTILELTATSFTIRYTDAANRRVELFQVPE